MDRKTVSGRRGTVCQLAAIPRMIAAVVVGLVLLVAIAPGTVGADPLRNPNAFQFENLACDNGQTVTIVTTNVAAAGQVVDGTAVTVVRGGVVIVNNLDTGEVEEFSFSIGQGKKTGLQPLVTCTGSVFFEEDGVSFRSDVVFFLTFTPRGA